MNESAAAWFRRARLRAGYRSQAELARALVSSGRRSATGSPRRSPVGPPGRSCPASHISSGSRPTSSPRASGSSSPSRSRRPRVPGSAPAMISSPSWRRPWRGVWRGACARRSVSGAWADATGRRGQARTLREIRVRRGPARLDVSAAQRAGRSGGSGCSARSPLVCPGLRPLGDHRWRDRREQTLPGVVSGPTEKRSLPLALPGPGGQRSYPPALRVSIALPKER
jgi:hypothetical protein